LKQLLSKEVQKGRRRRLYLSLALASVAKKTLLQKLSKIVVISALFKGAKNASIRNTPILGLLKRKPETVVRDAFAGYARLSSILKR
jgi:hypothetical protein